MDIGPARALRAVVFDLDGTLIDSAPDLRAALNRMLAAAGRREVGLDEVTAMIGDGVPKLVERALAATGEVPDGSHVEALAAWVSRFVDAYAGHGTDLTRAYPGIAETLARLKRRGLSLAVCTNKPQSATVEILDGLGLSGFFDAVLGGDVLDGVRKPDPAPLLAILRTLGADAKDAVMVGDHPNDVAGARAAGMAVVLCAYGYSRVPVDELGADAVIARFEDLPDALDGLS